jgi:L-aminopeptidase/D-esterase-like protein
MKRQNAITDVAGIRVGHAQNEEALTGCTVILGKDLDAGLMAGVDQRGGAPGTRETDLLHPMHLVERVHAVLLSGGSAFGLDAATGVMRCLEEQGAGFNAGAARVPIVPAAILFDLAVGDATVRPDAAMGYRACQAALQAAEGAPLATGNVGVGIGATVGKILGMGQAMKGGIGTASIKIGGGVVVGALVAVNAFGDVIDPVTGQILAGARSVGRGPLRIGAPGYFADTLEVMRRVGGRLALGVAARGHTVLGIVATNARLTKSEINKVAQMAHDGVARAVCPAHTMLDGDTVFALSTSKRSADVSIVGAFAAEVMAQAIVGAVRSARSVAGLPACSEAA